MNRRIVNCIILVIITIQTLQVYSVALKNQSQRQVDESHSFQKLIQDNIQNEFSIRKFDAILSERKISKRSALPFPLSPLSSSSPSLPPPELIKFELSDAKEPDEATKAFFRKIRQQMMMDMQKSLNPNNRNITSLHDMLAMNSTTTYNVRDDDDEDHSTYDDHDQSTHESQNVKVYVPLRYGRRKVKKSINLLPQDIQKMINLIIKDEPQHQQQQRQMRKLKQQQQDNVSSATAQTPNKVYQYGDKIISSSSLPLSFTTSNENQKTYDNLYSKGAAPSYDTDQKFTVTNYVPIATVKFKKSPLPPNFVSGKQFEPLVEIYPADMGKIVPQMNYAIQEVPAPSYKPELISYKQLNEPITSYPKLQYIQPIVPIKEESNYNGAYAEQQEQQEQPQQQQQLQQDHSYSNSLGYNNNPSSSSSSSSDHQVSVLDDSKYNALTSLVGKNPVEQFQGLTYLLSNEQTQKQQNLLKSPQENRAPITFPPKTKDIYDELKYESNSVGIDESNAYKTTPPLNTYPQKDCTPVTEAPEHDPHQNHNYHHHHHQTHNMIHPIEPVKIVHITPPTSISSSSYKTIHAGGLSPNYKGVVHDENGLQYASRYAFGYRVRDFHTGNDFGHRQNRDLDGVTRGEYHILLPDGRVQNVKYHADDSGFHADVQFETGP